ncbi:hypothetical protein [Candidatus Methanoperedens nitratireducens]|uniref:hypothetical protein n=1 Tax=Candidatus Methanoperedens nitratireducens TaxID=1392998 RepID=UPI001178A856|nr:hypothetical protein [Candidatus Methanoperedens nitroreducens]
MFGKISGKAKDFQKILDMDRVLEVQKCLHSLRPCYARVSGGKNEFQFLKFFNDGIWAEEVWDDPKRRLINEIRARICPKNRRAELKQ